VKSLLLKELEYVVFDLETTGFYADSGDEIVEIGAVLVKKLEIQKEVFSTFINPKRPIPAASTAVTGIKDSHVKDAPTIDKIMDDFLSFIGNRIIVAQNAKFDMSFMFKNFQRLNIPVKQNLVVDTIGISKLLFPYEQKHNLDAIMARLGIAKTGDRHRSLDDSKYTAQVLIEFIKLLEKQGISTLPEIEQTFIKPESISKAKKMKTRSLFG
jgi:DNA polymerase-3 subunit alpha (Gram-positive type)